MPDHIPAGPFKTVTLEDGGTVPFYIIKFDKDGKYESPQSLQHLMQHAIGHSDIFLFSHGWNNDWDHAVKRYENFCDGFITMRKEQHLPAPPNYKPLMVGIFWPSAALVTESEQAPKIAGLVAQELQMFTEIAGQLPAASATRLKELAGLGRLDQAQALELAGILQPLYSVSQEELAVVEVPSTAEMVSSWKELSQPEAPQPTAAQVSTVPDDLSAQDTQVQTAGLIDKLTGLVRDAIRVTTVWTMKDRAGVVGSVGVAPLLTQLLSSSQARLHLIGHSYGCKVLLSALCAPAALPRKVHSLLLLQPAVSHLCFAAEVPKTDHPGGYHDALSRVVRPILSTFSVHDFALTKVFHLALRRDNDLGDVKAAGGFRSPPSQYAALGGFGPRSSAEHLMPIQVAPQRYTFKEDNRLIGLSADQTISSHGDISNPSTWWALHNLIA